MCKNNYTIGTIAFITLSWLHDHWQLKSAIFVDGMFFTMLNSDRLILEICHTHSYENVARINDEKRIARIEIGFLGSWNVVTISLSSHRDR